MITVPLIETENKSIVLRRKFCMVEKYTFWSGIDILLNVSGYSAKLAERRRFAPRGRPNHLIKALCYTGLVVCLTVCE